MKCIYGSIYEAYLCTKDELFYDLSSKIIDGIIIIINQELFMGLSQK